MVDFETSVTTIYHQTLAQRGYQSDPAQLEALGALERCHQEWSRYKHRRRHSLSKVFVRPPIPTGVYLYGGVGRGKSLLMDCFYQAVPLTRKTRLHFHEFMREVHRELADLRGTVNPLEVLAKRIAKRYRMICFDEFHVPDITDALILHRLLEALLANRVGLIITTNFHPDDLYPNGLHRDRILPAIELLKSRFHLIQVDHGTDYRGRALHQLGTYHVPCSQATDLQMQIDFNQLCEVADEIPVLHIEHRELYARRRAGGVVWFDFKVLCGGPRSQHDYLELAAQFHTLFLSDVPIMPPRLAAEARRFTWLIDVLYDRRVKLIMSAQVLPEKLYLEGPLVNEFPRTVSRLIEMQSHSYLAQAKRTVDTKLT